MAERVVVVGAGAAGLQCAQLLRQNGVAEVIVVEASDYVGGRIRQDWGFLDGHPIEMGAEFIHGCTTLLADVAERGDWPLREVFTWAQGDGGPSEPAPDGGVGLYYVGRERRWIAHDAKDAEFQKLNESCWALGSIDASTVDSPQVSLDEHLRGLGVSDRMMAFAEAGYANTAGGTLKEQSLLGTVRLEQHWEAADCEGDIRAECTMAPLIAELARGLDVRLGWRVASVRHGPAGAEVTSANGESIRCDRVVITAPATVLRDGDIEFVPALPAEKTAAFSAIRMLGACKVILRFSRPFWPANFQGAICADSIAPEIWVNATGSQAVGTACKFRGSELQCSTDNGGAQGPAASQLEPAAAPAAWYTVTVFSTGPWADRLAALSEEGAARAVLSQLDEMFSTEPMAAAAGGSKTPASDVFDAAFRYNWADHPTIRGGYSFPSVHEQPDTRVRAAAPVGTRLFFAGEATNPKSSLTVHGAMETGFRAACEVAAAAGQEWAVSTICQRARDANVPHVAEDGRLAAHSVVQMHRSHL